MPPGAIPQVPEGASEQERKHVTVMFADVKGSMDLAHSMDVEQWWAIMQRFFTLLTEGITRYDGLVADFTGDGVMAVFGAPVALEDHARRACHAALWLRDALGALAEELRRDEGVSFAVRMGLNSGEVVAGTIGSERGEEYALIGHTAGVAQRMESLAEPGGIFMTEATASLVRGFFELREHAAAEVKGVEGPVGIFELIGGEGPQSAFEVSRAVGLSPFVGREEELTILEEGLQRALAGEGAVVAIIAEAGVGKSRLCHEFLERCEADGIEVSRAHALSHLSTVPFAPLLELLRDYFDISPTEEGREAREKVFERLELIDLPREDDALPLMFDLLGIADPEHRAEVLDPGASQRRLFALMNRLLRARSAAEPGVILAEDLHWMDVGSTRFLENLVAGVEGTRTLLLTTYRPEYQALWLSSPYCRELRLAPLEREATQRMLSGILGSDPSLDGLGELVHEHAGGNPFFTEEIVKTLAVGGALAGARGVNRLTRTVEEIEIPESVESVLAARIDRLNDREKTILQMASVIGHEFSAEILRQTAGLSEQELTAGLSGLLAAELILPAGGVGEYEHKHALAQRVAYRSQLASRRMARHAAVAEAIADVYEERLDELAALIAGHWEKAGEPLSGARWRMRAAVWAGIRDPNTALLQWRSLRALADAAPESAERNEFALTARVALLALAWRLGVPEGETHEEFEGETAALYEEVGALAEEAGNLVALTLAVTAYGGLRGMAGHPADMAALGVRALGLADRAGSRALKLSVLPCAAYGYFASGQYESVHRVIKEVVPEPPEDPKLGGGLTLVCPYASALLWDAAASAQTGELRAALAGCEEALALAREYEDFEAEAWTHMTFVQAMELAGDAHDILDHARAAFEIVERTGGAYSLGAGWRYRGVAHLMRCEWQHAVDAVERALAIWRPRGVGLESEPYTLAILARAQLALGDGPAALATALRAVALGEERGTQGFELEARLALAQVLAELRGADASLEIEAHLDRARLLADVTGARTLEPRIHVEFAGLARMRGDREAWAQDLTRARELFLSVGAPLLAERTEQMASAGVSG